MLSREELFLKAVRIKWDRIDKNSYLRSIEALKGLEELRLSCPVTFFVGENGSGKSTLLEAVAVSCGFNPEGGTVNYSFSTHDSHSELYKAVTPVKSFRRARWGYFLRAESFYNVASAEEEYNAPVGRSMHFHERSHGESFLEVLQQNLGREGLYILDEPEAALSPGRQLTLMLEIARCVRNDSQFIIVTHSPILLGLPDSQILSFDDGALKPITYEQTQSYRITKMFIDDRGRILKHLLEEEK